jgi:hypothetical protein
MALKVKDGYKCGYCGNLFKTVIKAEECKLNHDLIYVALSRTDLNRLINFIYLRDESLLTPTLLETLNKYLRGNTPLTRR